MLTNLISENLWLAIFYRLNLEKPFDTDKTTVSSNFLKDMSINIL